MNEKADFGERLRAAMVSAGYPLRPVVLEREFNTRYWGRSVTLQAARRWLRGEAIPTQISEVREMTEVEYNAFIARPLAKREWLAGKGGYQGNIKQAIARVCPGRETLYVDPSGSDYGRYVGRAVV